MFSDILEKLGINSSPALAEPIPAPASPSPQPAAPKNPWPRSMSSRSSKGSPRLTQVSSIGKHPSLTFVDLLKLLGIGSSLTARKELASELGCPGEKMSDSPQMTMWLHKSVLKSWPRRRNVAKELLAQSSYFAMWLGWGMPKPGGKSLNDET